MKGRICVVTGASSGIGKATAQGLADLGATVVMVCRDPIKGGAARHEIAATGGTTSIDLMIADLSSQQSIRQLAAEIRTKYTRLDVLLHNAAVNQSTFTKTVDGIETNFAVNHLAPFLLTHLLLDLLRASAPARIVNVTSSAQSPMDFDDLMGQKQFGAMRAYARSKMANVLFTYELARRLNGTGVTANCVHPGVVRTNLGRDFRGLHRILLSVMWPFMATPEAGAKTSVYLATSPEVQGITGKYFVNGHEARSSDQSYDETAARRLWQMSAELTKLDRDAV